MRVRRLQCLIDREERPAVRAAIFAQPEFAAFACATRRDQRTGRGQRPILVRASFLRVFRDGAESVVARTAGPMPVLLHDAGAARMSISAAVSGLCPRGIVCIANAAAPYCGAQFDCRLMIE